MDQAPKWLAKLETAIMMPMFYPFITGKESGILKKQLFEEGDVVDAGAVVAVLTTE